MGLLALAPGVWLYPQGERAPIAQTRPGVRAEPLFLPCVPSEAFGDGSHPTTRLCAGAVDLHCRLKIPAAFLDVGTGTGVLARIARARGVSFVAATDLDPEALRATRANTRLDERTDGGQGIHLAPLAAINDGPPDQWGSRFELIAANILEGPLRFLAPALGAALRPGGTLFLSGFTPLQIPGLRTAFESQGLRLTSQAQLDGWVLLSLIK